MLPPQRPRRTRPRLEDFLHRNVDDIHDLETFNFPFTQHTQFSPHHSSLQFDTSTAKTESAPQNPTSEIPPIIIPAFVISIRNFITQYILEWWILELVSWLISALCTAALVMVFAYYDKQKLPQWKFGLTLNALISLLAGITRSALLVPTFEALGQLKWNWFRQDSKDMLDFEVFDSASRGPWGSLMLMMRTGRRYEL